MKEVNFLDLFSGIGGFAIGAKNNLSIKNHFFSEVDEYAISVYSKRFPEAINLGDICQIDGRELKKQYEEKWIIAGGFPCQDISTAGLGKGLKGERSGLWFEMQRIVCEIQPRFMVAENVGALTFRGLNDVLGSLAEIGYNAEWTCIRAADMGALHERERIWIAAYPKE